MTGSSSATQRPLAPFVLVSLLVHALLVAWFASQPQPRPGSRRVANLVIQLLPPPRTLRAPEPEVPPEPPAQAKRPPAPTVPHAAPKPRSPDVRLTEAPPRAPDQAAPARLPETPDESRGAGDHVNLDGTISHTGAAGTSAGHGGQLDLALPRGAAASMSLAEQANLQNSEAHGLPQAIARTARPDCASAYGGLGILAVIPLVKDAVTGTGCKW